MAQQSSIALIPPQAPAILRPYLAPEVPPVRLANSPRLSELVRAGTLYLTVQDAIALALENNIDIEVARYNPLILALERDAFRGGRHIAGRAEQRLASRIGGLRAGRRGQPASRRRQHTGNRFKPRPVDQRHHFANRTHHANAGSHYSGSQHVQPHHFPVSGFAGERHFDRGRWDASVHGQHPTRAAYRRHRHPHLQRPLLE
jgi:hypothetical protein